MTTITIMIKIHQTIIIHIENTLIDQIKNNSLTYEIIKNIKIEKKDF